MTPRFFAREGFSSNTLLYFFRGTALEPVFPAALLYVLSRLPSTTLAARIPPTVLKLVHSARTRKTLVVLLFLGLLRRTNNILSDFALNNWGWKKAWDGSKELVVVTGGSSGIGEKVTADLAARGVKVIILDIQAPKSPLGPNVFFFQLDVTSADDIKTTADAICKAHGDPTVLINNAGIGGSGGGLLEGTEASVRRVFDINTISHFFLVKEFVPAMARANHGHVVTVASMASFVSPGGMVPYSCSKASALAFHEGLTQELRYWYDASNVHTSIIHPSWVATPMTQRLQDVDKGFRASALRPETVSDAIVEQIISGKSGQVILPMVATSQAFTRALPAWLQESIRGNVSQLIRRGAA